MDGEIVIPSLAPSSLTLLTFTYRNAAITNSQRITSTDPTVSTFFLSRHQINCVYYILTNKISDGLKFKMHSMYGTYFYDIIFTSSSNKYLKRILILTQRHFLHFFVFRINGKRYVVPYFLPSTVIIILCSAGSKVKKKEAESEQ